MPHSPAKSLSGLGLGGSLAHSEPSQGTIQDIDIDARSAATRFRERNRGGGNPESGGGRPRTRRHDGAWGYFYISPWIIGLIIFTGVPIIASLLLSLTTYDVLRPERTRFILFANYQWALADPNTQASFFVTVKYALVTIPLTLALALAAALLVNHRLLVGKRAFKTLFFMPAQIPISASVLMWTAAYASSGGQPMAWLHSISSSIGDAFSRLPMVGSYLAANWPSGWFTDDSWALPSLMIMSIWGIGNMTLIFVAGLQSVPTSLYDAAKVDGAGRFQTFRAVTLPMISPVMFYNLLLSIIAAAGFFTQAYVMGGPLGDPNKQLLLYNVNLYQWGWTNDEMGRACALAWIMFLVLIVVAVSLFRTSSRWVYYAGSER
jgi:multiple sugar transport system permease protein